MTSVICYSSQHYRLDADWLTTQISLHSDWFPRRHSRKQLFLTLNNSTVGNVPEVLHQPLFPGLKPFLYRLIFTHNTEQVNAAPVRPALRQYCHENPHMRSQARVTGKASLLVNEEQLFENIRFLKSYSLPGQYRFVVFKVTIYN